MRDDLKREIIQTDISFKLALPKRLDIGFWRNQLHCVNENVLPTLNFYNERCEVWHVFEEIRAGKPASRS